MPRTKVSVLVFAGIVLVVLLALGGLYLQQKNAFSIKNYLTPEIVSFLGLNSVTVESLLPEYDLVLNNQKYLLDHAKKVGIFRKEGVDLPGVEKIQEQIPSSSFHSVITDLKIVLSYNTADQPAEGTIHIDTSPLPASVAFENAKTLVITVFVLPSQVQKIQTDPVELEKVTRAFNAAILETLDSMTNRNIGQEKYFQYYTELTQLSQTNKLPITISTK